ncbi:MAG: DUF4012 domain-containing protein [Candidatus Shapirobacteria bacterium]|nr:DUF4012 domain-containing protein [Candidatus Shapirobacteria bacterium]
MNDKIFHRVGESQEKPLVLIVGGENFVNEFLNKALLLYNCQSISFTRNLDLEVFKKGNYVFCFHQNWVLIKEVLDSVSPQAKLLFALPSLSEKDSLEDKIIQLSFEKKLNVRIIRFAYVYGPGMVLKEYQKFLHLDGTIKEKAIFISDFIYGLLKAMFGNGTKGKSFFLLENNKNLGWQTKVDLSQGLEELEKSFQLKDQPKKEKLEIKKPILPKVFSKKAVISFLITLLILAIFYPFLSLGFWSLLGVQNLKQAKNSLTQGNLLKASHQADTALNSFQKSEEQLGQITPLLNFFSQEKTTQLNKLLNLGETVSEGLDNFLQATLQLEGLLKSIFQKEPLSIDSSIKEIKINLDQSFSQLSLAESQIGDRPEKEQLKEARDLILQARKGIELLPSLIGLEKKQTYLILFQNNSELRPTGGFIGSFGLLTLDEGQLVDFEIKDVYSADGQLKGHVEPPEDLKKYLGEAGWYFRDSNWDPDFPSSALKAAWFLEKETGRKVDGVIGVNLFLAQRILKSIGEIELPDYQEKINADNFFERAEYHSEINFFPGSTQKQDFLGSVARVLFEKIKQGDQKIWFGLAKNLLPSLKAKDLILWFYDDKATLIAQELAWGGEIKNVRCQVTNTKCLNDYLMVIEANVGINKANYFLKRSLSHQIKIEENGDIKETLRLDYQNTSPSEAFPAGRYKSYIRLYTPLNSKLISLKVTNNQTGQVEEITDREIKQDHNYQVFGFLIEVPIQEKRSVEIVYQLDEKWESEIGHYLFFLQKQPGIQDESFNFWLQPSIGVTALVDKLKFAQTTEGLFLSPSFDQDLVFEFSLIK